MYTEEELKNKYRFQEKWQRENGFKTKSYRLNGETIEKLLEVSQNKKMSQAGILREAFGLYKNQKETFDEKYKFVLVNKRINIKKGFKINDVLANEIENICRENNFLYGVFVTAILDAFFEYIEKQ